MDQADSSGRHFKCTCTREFTQESAYTRHQRSCTKGKKRLFSALSKAKDFLKAAKRPRLNVKNAPTSMASSSTQFRCPQSSSVSSDQVHESFSEESSSTYPVPSVAHPPQDVSYGGSSLQGDLPVPVSNSNLGTASTKIDEGLSLAQRRTKRTGVRMPQRYRQYEDILPQPPPSVPGHVAQQLESVPPAISIEVPTTACTPSQSVPFRTPRNVFGLVRQFFSSSPPSHDPEEAATFQDINSIPSVAPAELDSHAEPRDSFYPYPNQASFNLGHWYWNGSVQKSQESFKELLDIVGRPDFDPEDVRQTHWDRINSQLGTSVNNEEGYEWEDYDAGWHKTEVKIQVPFSRTTAQPDARPYVGAQLYHRPLVSVIREKLANVHDNEHFHYEPYQLRWSPPHLPHEVNIQGELYTSPMFMDAHRELQASPGEPGCDLPRVVTALMFWSDATQLTTFGNARLWPVYMYFGNESKYRRCKPSCHLANHVAYFQKV